MNKLVRAASLALGFAGAAWLLLAPGCRGPIEVEKGDLLLHASPSTMPAPQPLPPPRLPPQAPPQPDPGYHPE